MDETALAAYNRQLEKETAVFGPNEKYITEQIEKIDYKCQAYDSDIYWLTLARLAELALLSAGNYADNCEFQAAGDLLVNPRRVEIHVRYRSEPVIKDRHRGLTEQFRDVAKTKEGRIKWFEKETIVRVAQKPVLPYLYEKLENSGRISGEYLASADRRMKAVADTMALLAACHLRGSTTIWQYMQYAGDARRSFIESGLCRFDRKIFFQIGVDIDRIVKNKIGFSRFLCQNS